MPEKISPFKLNAEHIALDFVNTLDDRFAPDGPHELLPSYADLLRFCRQARVLTSAEAARLNALPAAVQKQALHQALELRELLARICYRWLDGKAPAANDQHAFAQIIERAPVALAEEHRPEPALAVAAAQAHLERAARRRPRGQRTRSRSA